MEFFCKKFWIRPIISGNIVLRISFKSSISSRAPFWSISATPKLGDIDWGVLGLRVFLSFAKCLNCFQTKLAQNHRILNAQKSDLFLTTRAHPLLTPTYQHTGTVSAYREFCAALLWLDSGPPGPFGVCRQATSGRCADYFVRHARNCDYGTRRGRRCWWCTRQRSCWRRGRRRLERGVSCGARRLQGGTRRARRRPTSRHWSFQCDRRTGRRARAARNHFSRAGGQRCRPFSCHRAHIGLHCSGTSPSHRLRQRSSEQADRSDMVWGGPAPTGRCTCVL